MPQNTTFSDSKLVTIDNQKYEVRTVTQWVGGPGTINGNEPINSKVQYKPGPTITDPFPEFRDLAERTENKNDNNGWSFRPIAEQAFKQELVKTGPNSLSSQLDSATQSAVARDANVPLPRAQQALSKITPTKTNQALSAPSQDPNAPPSNQNAAQAAQNGSESEKSEATQESFDSGNNNLKKIQGEIGDDPATRKPTEYGNFRYPLTLKVETQDCIKFTMGTYNPKSLSSSGIAKGNPFENRSFSPGGTVVLPIQPSINDSNVVQWNSDTLNAAEAIAATAALAGINKGGEGFASALGSGSELLQKNSGDMKTAVGAFFAQEAAGVKGLLTRTTGAIVNPNMELLFQGPQLRNFTFNFVMSAREPDESKEIRNIIRFFKQGMSVKRAKTGLFLKTPHIFKIQYLHKNSDHPWINQIKECALTGCNVNYTPAGNYATFYDGAMTSYELSLTFGELEPIYDDDYKEGSKTSETKIGY